MSINIDEALLRKALWTFELMSALPMHFDWGSASYPTSSKTYDGEYIILAASGAPGFPAASSRISYTKGGTRATDSFMVYVTIRVNNDASVYIFFFEPQKGDYGNYQGFQSDGVPAYFAKSRNGGAETSTTLAAQDWTVDVEFYIKHETDQSNCYFGVDGAQVANHTTNISAQPYEVNCCEPMNVARTFYLKFPPGMCISNNF